MTEDIEQNKSRLCIKCENNLAHRWHAEDYASEENFRRCYYNLNPVEKSGKDCSYFKEVRK